MKIYFVRIDVSGPNGCFVLTDEGPSFEENGEESAVRLAIEKYPHFGKSKPTAECVCDDISEDWVSEEVEL